MGEYIDNIVYKVTKGEGPFEPLSRYFGSLQPDDLIDLDLESFPELVEFKDKILMTVFINKKLIPYLEYSSYKPKEIIVNKLTLKDGVLNARGCLSSRELPSHNGRVCISDLADRILDMKPLLKSINFLDLSGNELYSGDIVHIYGLLIKLLPYIDNATVSLEGNKIHGVGKYRVIVDTFLNKIIEIKEIRYIVLVSNPFNTIDRQDFFDTLTVDNNACKKLIWIQQYNISNSGWHFMLKSMDVCEYVKKNHIEYYSKS